jgi:hypothetical protein
VIFGVLRAQTSRRASYQCDRQWRLLEEPQKLVLNFYGDPSLEGWTVKPRQDNSAFRQTTRRTRSSIRSCDRSDPFLLTRQKVNRILRMLRKMSLDQIVERESAGTASQDEQHAGAEPEAVNIGRWVDENLNHQ